MRQRVESFVRTQVTGAFVLAVVLVIAIGVISYNRGVYFAESAGRVAHTHAVEMPLEKFLYQQRAIEDSARSYVVTGDERYLRTFHNATMTVEQALRELRRVTADSPRQRQRIDSIEPLVEGAVKFWQQAIDARTAGGLQAGVEAIGAEAAKQTMDAIRDLIDDMHAEEWERLQQYDTEEHASGRNTMWSFGVLALLIVALLATVAYLVWHEGAVRQRAQLALQAAYEDLDQRVEARTVELARANALLRREITEHEHAEHARQESEERFTEFMQHLPGVAFMKDVDGRYVYINGTFQKLFHRTLAEAAGKTDDEMWPAPIAAQLRANDQEVIRSRRAIQTTETVPHDDGMHEWLASKFPVFDAAGAVSLVAGVAIDITERRRAEAQLRELEKHAQQRERLADIGAITAQIVHDLGNPLAGLSMQAQLVLQRIKRDGNLPVRTIAQSMERMLSEVGRLDTLIKEFMDFSREQRLDLKPVNLSRFLRDVADLWEPVAASRNIALTVETPSDGPLLTADDEKLRRVLDNLVKNAIEAIDRGPGQVGIQATLAAPDAVCIAVADTGPGMPETLHAFRLFETTKPQGSGLGLAVVKQIILAHRGRIDFTRAEPHGTVFRIELPRGGPAAL